MAGLTHVSIGIVAAALLAAPAHAQLPKAIDDAINKVAVEGAAPDFARCKLQDALWGGYDVRVFITQGVNLLPYRLELKSGRFSYGIDPDPEPGTPPHFERDGRLVFATSSDAFARRLPFFITAPRLDGSNQLRVDVLSNLEASVDEAMLLAIIEDGTDSDDLQVHRVAVSSSTSPQPITVTDDRLERATKVRLAILRGADQRAIAVGCVISNEFDVVR